MFKPTIRNTSFPHLNSTHATCLAVSPHNSIQAASSITRPNQNRKEIIMKQKWMLESMMMERNLRCWSRIQFLPYTVSSNRVLHQEQWMFKQDTGPGEKLCAADRSQHPTLTGSEPKHTAMKTVMHYRPLISLKVSVHRFKGSSLQQEICDLFVIFWNVNTLVIKYQR